MHAFAQRQGGALGRTELEQLAGLHVVRGAALQTEMFELAKTLLLSHHRQRSAVARKPVKATASQRVSVAESVDIVALRGELHFFLEHRRKLRRAFLADCFAVVGAGCWRLRLDRFRRRAWRRRSR